MRGYIVTANAGAMEQPGNTSRVQGVILKDREGAMKPMNGYRVVPIKL
jgi:hypothetical protein